MADINKEGKSARAPFDDAVENKNEVAPDLDPNKKPKRRSGLGFQVLMPFLLCLAAAIGVILLPALS
ncbi:MAG TPA: hypothetical protein VK927_07930, partial [Adhaeribacter sp.]|nr:hypothetical protein [Adhaeribacter sp.]